MRNLLVLSFVLSSVAGCVVDSHDGVVTSPTPVTAGDLAPAPTDDDSVTCKTSDQRACTATCPEPETAGCTYNADATKAVNATLCFRNPSDNELAIKCSYDCVAPAVDRVVYQYADCTLQ